MKKAILAVSFGTSFNDTREKTIDIIENDLRSAFPDREFYRAWTSKIITSKLKERDGVSIDMPGDALERMKSDGVSDIIVQPTFILPGLENDYLSEKIISSSKDFDQIMIGAPLLDSDEDIRQTAEIISEAFEDLEDEALVLMGHGVFNDRNSIYIDLENAINTIGRVKAFIGTVEAEPDLLSVLEKVRASGLKKVVLTPLLIVSGDHANNDMAGEDDDSWASVFRREGFEVRCILKGLGEYEAIRKMFVNHARSADPINRAE